jgi:hypothetical protein
MKLLGELEEAQEEMSVLESQLVRYRKTYPEFPNTVDE